MRISIITDEISADPETAVELGVQWGVKDFELRGYYCDRVPRLTAYQKQRLQEVLDRYDARVIALSPGLFKFPFPAKQPEEIPLPWLDQLYYEKWAAAHKQIEEHLNELLPESLDYACELGAQNVIIFAFSRGGQSPGEPPDELLNCLLKAAERTKASGLQLVIENEAGFWADTGERTGYIVQQINHPALGVNWDPGNAFFEGDTPYPNGYDSIRGRVKHVHFKDAIRNKQGGYEYSVDGGINWAGQICALKADGYQGYISVETHLRPKVAVAKAALERLSNLIDVASVSIKR
ncbi:MAG: sugar phosphate isomerase/epimerase family protein [Anaerolineaceae bacterium]